MRAGILALGTYVPSKILTNQDFETYLDTSDEWIVSRTGIHQRRIAYPNEFTSTLAFRAVENLIENHGREALEGVDAIIVATNTPDALFPNTAALVQHRFELKAFTYDLFAGCPGWVYATAQATALIQSGLARKVLAIGAEALSKIVDWSDRSTAVLFGDGAGAAVIGPVEEEFGFRSFVLGTDGSGAQELMMGCTAPRLPDGTPLSKKNKRKKRQRKKPRKQKQSNIKSK
jgi:3-oxoacyl-[acyl-carrier-protein] synthase-3